MTKRLSLLCSCCPSQNSVELKRSRPSGAHTWQRRVWAPCPARSTPRYRHADHTRAHVSLGSAHRSSWSQNGLQWPSTVLCAQPKSQRLSFYEKRRESQRLLRGCPLNVLWWTGKGKSNEPTAARRQANVQKVGGESGLLRIRIRGRVLAFRLKTVPSKNQADCMEIRLKRWFGKSWVSSIRAS